MTQNDTNKNGTQNQTQNDTNKNGTQNQTQNDTNKKDSKFSVSGKSLNRNVIGFMLLSLLLIVAALIAFLSDFSTVKFCVFGFWVGAILTLLGYYHLIFVLPTIKTSDTSITAESLKASYWLVILGLALIVIFLILGFLLIVHWYP